MPTVVGNTFGSARVSVVMGMVVTGWAGSYLLGAPIAGFILDAASGENKGITGYRPAIVDAGAMTVASIIGLSIRLKNG
ncbi:hypothetical protein PENNAL_c0026G05211 [Penicillium nalgiovense]|uniref:Major facilitator superfamily (MFS) profile domain-containing protein n=1 Tax=Penicillium nalgiovense TaxID=60175 RepID=A0A1V6YBD9_PENNA|nr:hypothetical protein PENNAL_c0026G05211 [Penicillium nalgiovense]